MRPTQIEAWALDIIDHINSKNPIEDFNVELKSEWPEPPKAARQIAGHANAARGEPILWLIGVDEDKGVIGANHEELANWYKSVESEFDGGIAPSMIDLNIPIDNKIIEALYFETDRAPYVIKNPSFGTVKGDPVSHETPWREGTSTRTARRSDLIKMLIPTLNLPEIEVLGGELVLSVVQQSNWHWTLELRTYITPQIGYPCVLPFHQCEAYFQITDQLERTFFDGIRLIPPYNKIKEARGGLSYHQEPDSLTIHHTQNEALVEGPGQLNIRGEISTDKKDIILVGSKINISIKIRPSHTDKNILINSSLVWCSPDQGSIGKWILETAT